jgi:hypothetical protein
MTESNEGIEEEDEKMEVKNFGFLRLMVNLGMNLGMKVMNFLDLYKS